MKSRRVFLRFSAALRVGLDKIDKVNGVRHAYLTNAILENYEELEIMRNIFGIKAMATSSALSHDGFKPESCIKASNTLFEKYLKTYPYIGGKTKSLSESEERTYVALVAKYMNTEGLSLDDAEEAAKQELKNGLLNG